MAHYAKVTKHNNLVVNVIVADSDFVQHFSNEPNIEYIQTSYNTRNGEHLLGGTPLRKNYAAIGYVWDPDRDAFYPQKPYESWILNEEKCIWEAPIPIPEEGNYVWNEETQSWDLREE